MFKCTQCGCELKENERFTPFHTTKEQIHCIDCVNVSPHFFQKIGQPLFSKKRKP